MAKKWNSKHAAIKFRPTCKVELKDTERDRPPKSLTLAALTEITGLVRAVSNLSLIHI